MELAKEEESDFGHPIQIIDFTFIPKRPSKLKLMKKDLQEILALVGQRPIHVISVAGASRQGKSYFLSILLNFLHQLEKHRGNEEAAWQHLLKQKNLNGFEFKHGIDRQTVGFWMWSKPFILKKCDGTEIAIVLMDTQGVFDNKTTKRDCSMIVGLALLTSSTLIYNLMQNIQEDQIEIFNSFVEFGMYSLQEDQQIENAFQKLIFLVRDWNMPQIFPYGEHGGRRLVDKVLKITEETPEELQLRRRNLKACFESIEGVLLPYPGESTKQKDYDGQLSSLDLEFLNHARSFGENLLTPDTLEPKRICGQVATGFSLLTYFQKIVDGFNANSKDFPKPQTMFQMVVEVKLVSIVEKLVHDFEGKLQDEISQRCRDENAFVQPLELEKIFNLMHQTTLTTFKKQAFLISNMDEKKMERQSGILSNGLLRVYHELSAANDVKRRELIERAVEFAVEAYRRTISNQLQEMSLLPEQYKEVQETAKLETEREITRICGERDVIFFQDIYSLLTEKLDATDTSLQAENQERLNQDEDICKALILALTEQYQERLEMNILPEETNMTKIENIHTKAEEIILKGLEDGLLKIKNKKLHQFTQSELLKNMHQILQNCSLPVAQHQNRIKAEVNVIVNQIIQKFKLALHQAISNSSTLDDIRTQHKMVKADTMGKLTTMVCTQYPEHAATYFQETIKAMDEYLIQMESKFEQKQLDKEDQLKEAINQTKRNFETKLEASFCQANFDFETDFGEISSRLKNMALDLNDSNAEWRKDEGLHTRFTTEIRSFVDYTLENTKKGQEQQIQEICQVLRGKLHDLLDEYREFLKNQFASGKINNQGTLHKLHNSKAEEYLNTTKNMPMTTKLPKSKLRKLTDDLKSGLDNLLKSMEAQLAEKCTKIKEIKDQSLKQYSYMMNCSCGDYSGITEEQFENFHVKSLQRSIERIGQECNSNYYLNSKDQEDLEEQIKSVIKQEFHEIKVNFSSSKAAQLHKQCCTEFDSEALHKMANCETEEAFKCFLDRVSDKQIDYLEFHLPSSVKKEEPRSKLRAALYELTQKHITDFKTQSTATSEAISCGIQRAITKYELLMNKFILRRKNVWIVQTPEEISKQDESIRGEIISQILAHKTDGFLPNQIKKFEETLRHQLDSKLNEFQSKNSAKLQEVERDRIPLIESKITAFKKTLEISTLIESKEALNTAINESKAIICKTVATDKLKQQWNKKFMKKMTEIWDSWRSELPEEAKLELAAERAKQKYHEEMKDRTKSNSHMDFEMLQREHKSAVRIAVEGLKIDITQTARKYLEEILSRAFRQYQDVNDMRYTDSKNIAIGIDLGTTYSCVAVFRNGEVEMIPTKNDSKYITPSYVLFLDNGEIVVGQPAKDEAVIYPDKAIFDAKRLIGRKFHDEDVAADRALWPFKVINHNERPKIQIEDKSFFPEQISAELLKKLKSDAEEYLNLKGQLKNAVITVPAYFSDSQRKATKDAGAVAGLKVLAIINEPTSAAIAYSLSYTDDKSRNVLVYDLGGGTFDVSVLVIKKGDIEVKAVSGDNHLGGEDFDNNLLNYCLEQFKLTTGIDLRDGNEKLVNSILRRIRHICEKKKITLSDASSVKIIAENVTKDSKDLSVEVTREKFNELNASQFKKTITIVEAALSGAQMQKEDVDEVVLVGGSTRIPKIQQLLEEFFPGKRLIKTINPDEVVARGAAIFAAMTNGSQARELKNLKFSDVTPMSLGMDVLGGGFSIIIKKNTKVPATKTQRYVTVYDDQTDVCVNIFEGEDPVAKNNNLLGKFTLSGIPKAPGGEESIDVTIHCNKEGILDVTAVVTSTGNSESVKIESKRTNLTVSELSDIMAN